MQGACSIAFRFLCCSSLGAGGQEKGGSQTGSQQADHARSNHNQGIGTIERRQCQEACYGQRHQEGGVQGAAADAPGGHQHNRQHRWFEHGEHRRQQRQLSP